MVIFSRRYAFNLPEVLITLTIVGVISAILIPIIQDISVNEEKILYKKAVNSLQSAISTVMSEFEPINPGNFMSELSQHENIRTQLALKLNTPGNIRTESGSGSASNPDFYSGDGMIWWNVPKTWPTGAKYIDVYVDVNGEKGSNLLSDNASSGQYPDQLKIRIMKDGRVIVPEVGSDAGNWSFETDYLTSQKLTDD